MNNCKSMPCKNTGWFFWLLTLSAGDFSTFYLPVPAAATLCQWWEQPPPAPSSLCQTSCKWQHLAPWEAIAAQPLPLCIPSGKQVVEQNGSKQQAASWTKLRMPPRKNTLYLILLLCPWTCTFSCVSCFKTAFFWGGKEGLVAHTSLLSAIVSSLLK